jgi:predicted  nucleic acid-binding Zn-ribbon protein
MKFLVLVLLLSSLSFSQDDDFHFENKKLYDDEFTIKKHGDKIVHIDEDYNLYVDNQEIDISDQERRLLKDYVYLHRQIVKKALRIGKEGAKLGLKAGVSAISTTFSALGDLISGDERKAERKAERKFDRMEKEIEYDAENIEELGEEIEKLANELNNIRDELKDRIRELRYIDEF